MERSIIISPSILAADFSDIRNALDVVRKSGTDWVHLDVMDGNFVKIVSWYDTEKGYSTRVGDLAAKLATLL